MSRTRRRGVSGGALAWGVGCVAGLGLLLVSLRVGVFHGAGLEVDGPAPSARLAPSIPFPAVGGGPESLEDYRGRVVVLNLWGTWCPPCIREIPHLVEVQDAIEHRGGVVIGLAVDSGSPEDILAFWAERLELEPAYPMWMGSNREVRRSYDAFGLPNTLVIDRDGYIRERFLGLVTADALMVAVEPLL